jgi:hypothetical protein
MNTVIDVVLAKAYRIRDVRFFSCHFWDVHTAELVHDISPFEQWLRLTPLLVDDFSRGLCYPIYWGLSLSTMATPMT